MPEPITDAQWTAFCAQPDEIAFAPVYESTRALVYTLCFRVLGDRELAFDAFQSAYARLLAEVRSASDRPPEAPSSRQWIARLALREAWSLAKRIDRRARREFPMDQLPPAHDLGLRADAQAARRQLREQIDTLVRVLPERERLPLQLHYFHGLSQAEIAGMLEVDKSTVSRRIEKGLKRLQPLVRRAGLGESLSLLAAIAAGGALLEPPSAAAAGAIFASASAAAAGMAAAGHASILASAHSLGGALTNLKMLGWGLAAVAVVGLSVVAVQHRPKMQESRPSAPSAPASVADASGSVSPSRSNPRLLTPSGPPALAAQPEPSAASATNGNAVAVETAAVEGVVRDETTAEPVAGALVSFSTSPRRSASSLQVLPVQTRAPSIKAVRSGPDGSFRLAGIARAASGGLDVDASGFVPAQMSFKPAPGAVSRVDVALDPAGAVVVDVADAQGRPIAGAVILGRIASTTPGSGFFKGARTDLNGRVVLRSVSLTHPVELAPNADGYLQPNPRVPDFSAGTTATLAFVLDRDPAFRIIESPIYAGIVQDAKGRPISGATIVYGPRPVVASDEHGAPLLSHSIPPGRLQIVSARTGPDGRYRLEVPEYLPNTMLSAETAGQAPAAKVAPAPPIDSLQVPLIVDFALKPGRFFSGKVVDANGRPVADCEATLTRVLVPEIDEQPLPPLRKDAQTDLQGLARYEDLSTGRFEVARTDLQGVFRFDDLPAGVYFATARRNGFPDAVSPKARDRSDVEIKLLPYGVFRGRVIDAATKEPIRQFTVRRGPPPPVSLARGRSAGGARAGRASNIPAIPGLVYAAGEGRFSLDHLDPRQPLGLTIQSDGYADCFRENLPVGEDPAAEYVFALGNPKPLRLRIVSSGVGIPLAGAYATAGVVRPGSVAVDWDGSPPDFNLDLAVSARSDANGYAALSQVDPSSSLLIAAKGYARRILGPGEISALPRVQDALQVVLDPGASVTGASRMAAGAPENGIDLMREASGSVPVQRFRSAADPDGNFRFDDLPAGDYRIEPSPRYPTRVALNKVLTAGRKFRLAAGEAKTIDLAPPPGAASLSGRLLLRGVPAPRGVVQLIPDFDPSCLFVAVRADEAGRFAVSGLAAGDYMLQVDLPGNPTGGMLFTTRLHIEGAVEREIEIF